MALLVAPSNPSTEPLHALAEILGVLGAVTGDHRAALQQAAEVTVRRLGGGCAILLLSDDGARVDPVAIAMRDASATNAAREALAPEGGEATFAMSVARGETTLLSRDDPDALACEVGDLGDWVRRASIRGILAVPLRADNHPLGVLMLFRDDPDARRLDASDRAFAECLAAHVGLAIANARLSSTLKDEAAQRQRVEEEAKTFVALVETCTDFIAMANFDGRVLYVNDAGRRLVGLDPRADARATTLSDFHTADGLARAEIIRRVGHWQGEGVLRHFKTGELIPTRISSFIARDEAGAPVCFATVQHDLRETRRLETQLRQAQKMEAIGQLAGGIAHDFNNMLSVILSYASLVGSSLPEGSPERADVAEIEAAGHRAASLTAQLLAFGGQQVLQPNALNLEDLVMGMWRMLRGTLREDIELRFERGAGLASVFADKGQLEQVTLNLVVNARDAMPRGGVLTIATANVNVDANDPLSTRGLTPGAYVMLSVDDTGTGMDSATRARVFEPFFTTKGLGKGTGLGLPTVLGIIHQSGGHVLAESELGKGSSFRVYLQRSDGDLRRPERRSPASAVREAGRRSESDRREVILLSEDDSSVRTLTSRVLRSAGYEVIEATNAEEALQASRQHARIDLLLTDVIMPHMGGRELAARMAPEHPEARVLYVSGYSEDALSHHGVLDAGIELLHKPITPSQLLETVRQLLDRGPVAHADVRVAPLS
jgi:PAS domain S-box-containing protein